MQTDYKINTDLKLGNTKPVFKDMIKTSYSQRLKYNFSCILKSAIYKFKRHLVKNREDNKIYGIAWSYFGITVLTNGLNNSSVTQTILAALALTYGIKLIRAREKKDALTKILKDEFSNKLIK